MTHPDHCSDCREFHAAIICDDVRGEAYNCSPRGTRWRLVRSPGQKACRTVHAVMAEDEDMTGQGSLL